MVCVCVCVCFDRGVLKVDQNDNDGHNDPTNSEEFLIWREVNLLITIDSIIQQN